MIVDMAELRLVYTKKNAKERRKLSYSVHSYLREMIGKVGTSEPMQKEEGAESLTMDYVL